MISRELTINDSAWTDVSDDGGAIVSVFLPGTGGGSDISVHISVQDGVDNCSFGNSFVLSKELPVATGIVIAGTEAVYARLADSSAVGRGQVVVLS